MVRVSSPPGEVVIRAGSYFSISDIWDSDKRVLVVYSPGSSFWLLRQGKGSPSSCSGSLICFWLHQAFLLHLALSLWQSTVSGSMRWPSWGEWGWRWRQVMRGVRFCGENRKRQTRQKETGGLGVKLRREVGRRTSEQCQGPQN